MEDPITIQISADGRTEYPWGAPAFRVAAEGTWRDRKPVYNRVIQAVCQHWRRGGDRYRVRCVDGWVVATRIETRAETGVA